MELRLQNPDSLDLGHDLVLKVPSTSCRKNFPDTLKDPKNGDPPKKGSISTLGKLGDCQRFHFWDPLLGGSWGLSKYVNNGNNWG